MGVSETGPVNVTVVAANGAFNEGGAQIPLRAGVVIIIGGALADVAEGLRHVASPLRLPAKTESLHGKREVSLGMELRDTVIDVVALAN